MINTLTWIFIEIVPTSSKENILFEWEIWELSIYDKTNLQNTHTAHILSSYKKPWDTGTGDQDIEISTTILVLRWLQW